MIETVHHQTPINKGNSSLAMDSSTQPLIQKPQVLDETSQEESYSKNARKVLLSRPSGVLNDGTFVSDQQMVQKANVQERIIFPWMTGYKIWWSITAVGAIFTVMFGPYQIAFEDEPGVLTDTSGIIEMILNGIFAVDILVNFNLAFYSDQEVMVFERRKICQAYLRRMFWVDLIGVFPFETLALALSGNLGSTSRDALLYSLLRLLRFVRLHRMKRLSDVLQYNARISLLWFTLLRNFAAVFVVAHFEACLMYFLARLNDLDPETTWIGSHIESDNSDFQRYITSLYWSIITFCTVGYGDFSPVNTQEQLAGSIFMLLNIVVAAWIIGSITLLVVKGDEKTGEYRDSLETLHQYSSMHRFDTSFRTLLQAQLRLEFHNREIADEQVLKNFPSAMRRKILRTLYLEPLLQTKLMTGVRPQFVDAFLASCSVEIFSPGEEIVERGSILSDLFLLVGGVAEVPPSRDDSQELGNIEDPLERKKLQKN